MSGLQSRGNGPSEAGERTLIQITYDDDEKAIRNRLEREIEAATDEELGGPIVPGDAIDEKQSYSLRVSMMAPGGPDDTHFEERIRRALKTNERARRAGLTAHERIAEARERSRISAGREDPKRNPATSSETTSGGVDRDFALSIRRSIESRPPSQIEDDDGIAVPATR